MRALHKTRNLGKRLIGAGIKRGGSFYLTYNRFATHDEIDSAYPQFRDFFLLKRKYDPDELFQSDWYTHYKALYS